jgi:molybdopterin-guanine dinucleotide biosynthesis protein A
MNRTIGLILAGGRSQRMGGSDKTFISLRGKPLLEHAIDRLAPQVDAVAISSNAPPELFGNAGLPVIPDIIDGFQGPLAGIHAGLMRYPNSHVISVAVDLPFLPGNLVQRLRDGMHNCRCAYASNGVQHALAILWAPGMGNELEMFLRHGGRSIRDWLAKNGSPVFFEADADSDILFNVNSPEDLEAAEQRLRTASGDG